MPARCAMVNKTAGAARLARMGTAAWPSLVDGRFLGTASPAAWANMLRRILLRGADDALATAIARPAPFLQARAETLHVRRQAA